MLEAKLFWKAPTINVLDADIQAAGVAKTGERDRIADIHALHETFGTDLSATGTQPRTAMAAMRDSRIELITDLYTDPLLLDVAGAVESIPDFRTPASSQPDGLALTGTQFRQAPSAEHPCVLIGARRQSTAVTY